MEQIQLNTPVGQAIDHVIEEAPLLDKTGRAITEAVASLEGRSEFLRSIEDFLHGTWLGHPLHAVLTDVTIGSWVSGAVLDFASVVTDSDDFAEAADMLTGIGTVSSLGTFAAGLTDYSRIKNDAIRPGLVHGLLNVAAITSFAISTLARRAGNRGLGLMASTAGLGITTLSAWIGGDMVYRHKVGVNHAVPPSKTLDEWMLTNVMLADLPEGQPRRTEVDGTPILIYRYDGTLYAMGAVCSHAGGPLEEGDFDGTCVECPWHASVFDLRDGSVVHGPATMQEPTFEVRVQDGRVQVRTMKEHYSTDQ